MNTSPSHSLPATALGTNAGCVTASTPRRGPGFGSACASGESGDAARAGGETARNCFLRLSAAHPEPCSYASAPSALIDAYHAMLDGYGEAPQPRDLFAWAEAAA